MAYKTLKPYTIQHDDEDGTQTRVTRIAGNASDRKIGLRRAALLELGIVEPYGCNCSHCAMDYDCCGYLFPGTVTIERVRGGFKVSQHYPRNV